MLHTLPQELVDAFIDEVSSSPAGLRSCSLVHSSWTRRSQQHLFRHAELGHTARVASLRELVDARPCIRAYVRGIALHASSVIALSAVLSLLPNVRTLDAQKLVFEETSPPCQAYSSVLTELCLDHCTFISADALHMLLAGFPNLRSLSLLYVTVTGGAMGRNAAEHSRPTVATRMRLRELRIHVPDIRADGADAVGAILGQSIASLDRLGLTLNRECCVVLLQALLLHVGASLKHLNLDVMSYRGNAGVILSRVDMLLLPSLTSLSITANLSAGLSMDRIDSKSWNDYITAFLAGLPANGLQKITIRVHIWPTDLHFLGAIQWARLDTALSGPGFSALKRMAVVVQTRTLEMDVQARVRSMIHSRAETLDERDIVRVEFHEPARGP